MSTYIFARLGLTGDAPLPKCYMGGTESNIPVVEWAEGDFYVGLSNLDDPATYLREWAHGLNALAAEVDAARDQREPKGYDAPVGHVGGCNERCDGDSHYLIGVEQ